MTIFGGPATNQTQILYGNATGLGSITSPAWLNYYYSTILLLSFSLSLLLNPLVFLFYSKQRPSEATLLFRLLALLVG